MCRPAANAGVKRDGAGDGALRARTSLLLVAGRGHRGLSTRVERTQSRARAVLSKAGWGTLEP